jgi:hypothetical protein
LGLAHRLGSFVGTCTALLGFLTGGAWLGCNLVLGNHELTPSDAGPDSPSDTSLDSRFEASDDVRADGSFDAGVIVVADAQYDPVGIAVDPNYLYWVDRTDESGGAGSVWRMAFDGGGIAILAGQNQPLDIVVDPSGTAYWLVNTSRSSPFLGQCMVRTATAAEWSVDASTEAGESPDAGGAACAVYGVYEPLRLAITDIYIAILSVDGAQNPYVGYTATTPTQLYNSHAITAAMPQAVAATDTILFYGDGTHIDDVEVTGGGLLGTTLQAVCNTTCGSGQVVKDIAVDTTPSITAAYWVTNEGSVVTASYSPPGGDSTLLATVGGVPQRMALDLSYVYVTVKTSAGGEIVAVPRASTGKVLTLAELACVPFGIAVDATRVYWTCSDDTIRSSAKP